MVRKEKRRMGVVQTDEAPKGYGAIHNASKKEG